jgi:hypothetical protein
MSASNLNAFEIIGPAVRGRGHRRAWAEKGWGKRAGREG